VTAPIIELIIRNGDPEKVVAVACGTCRIVARTPEDATQCCAPKLCQDCGAEVKRYMTLCDDCACKASAAKYAKKTAAAFNKATKVLVSDYQGSHVCLHLSPDESDYLDLDDIADRLDDDEGFREAHPWVWGCYPTPWPIPEMDEVMSSLLEEFPEGAMDNFPDINGLQSVVVDWFQEHASEPSGYVMVNDRVVVVLDPENTPERMGESE